MEIIKTHLEGVCEIKNQKFKDHRGTFVKIFHKDLFQKAGLVTDFKESFYSVSKKSVLRGMHFQLPPHDHVKLVYVTRGEILDVALDIRKGSPTFGKYFSTILSEDNAQSLYLDKGFAHGFLTLSREAVVTYLTSTVYYPSHDSGIFWNSFGFDWGIVSKPILSERDSNFESFGVLDGA